MSETMPTNLFNVFLNSNDSIGLVSFTVNGDLDTTAIIKNIVTSRIAVGMRVTGLYIPNNTKVVSIDSATQITISNNLGIVNLAIHADLTWVVF